MATTAFEVENHNLAAEHMKSAIAPRKSAQFSAGDPEDVITADELRMEAWKKAQRQQLPSLGDEPNEDREKAADKPDILNDVHNLIDKNFRLGENVRTSSRAPIIRAQRQAVLEILFEDCHVLSDESQLQGDEDAHTASIIATATTQAAMAEAADSGNAVERQ
jgi:hypothetical protein